MAERTVVKHTDGTTITVTTTGGGTGQAAPNAGSLFAKLTADQLKVPVPSDIECSQSIKPDHITEASSAASPFLSVYSTCSS